MPGCRQHRRATQGTLTIRHVDNARDRVKFRRLDKAAGAHGANKRRREAREYPMAAAEGPTSPQSLHRRAADEKASHEQAWQEPAWHEVVLQTFRRNDI